MYISKAKHYAISRAIFKLEEATRRDNYEERWEAYDVLRELGIDHMFHRMPDSVCDRGDEVFYRARRKAQQEA